MIKTAIFDFDGTLADTIPLCREAFRRAIQKLDGRILTDEEIERQFGPDRKLHADLAPAPFPGTAELLSTLRNLGIRLAMVTGKRLESAEISLQFFHLSEFFPILETGSPEGGVKPDRIKRALSRLNAVASEAIYIGDAPTDVDACRSVPIRILSAGWAAEADINGLREKKPDFLLTRFEDLERFFREHHENEGL